jgi:hypothetical protein
VDLSIVINCSDDFHVFETIASIDEDVEIICSITPNEKIATRLKEMAIPYAVTPKGSQSKTTNAGISLTTNNKFILMDSDCYFEEGFIRRVYFLLDEYLVVNGHIIFDYNDSLLSRAISKCKNFDDKYENFAHKPGLGLRKDLLNYIGGDWFNEILPWAEDSELSYRIDKAGVRIYHEREFSIHHLPTSYKHNLRSCFRYGGGDYLRHRVLGDIDSASLVDKYKEVLKKFSFFEILVMLTNDISYQCGYTGKAITTKRSQKPEMKE